MSSAASADRVSMHGESVYHNTPLVIIHAIELYYNINVTRIVVMMSGVDVISKPHIIIVLFIIVSSSKFLPLI